MAGVLGMSGGKMKRSGVLLPKANNDLHLPLCFVLLLELRIFHTPPHHEDLAHIFLLSASFPLSFLVKFLAFMQQTFTECLLGTRHIFRHWGVTRNSCPLLLPLGKVPENMQTSK